jgi:hypothetical protein
VSSVCVFGLKYEERADPKISKPTKECIVTVTVGLGRARTLVFETDRAMMQIMAFLVALMALGSLSDAFAPSSLVRTRTSTCVNLIDPAAIDIGIAAVSAGFGAVSQMPRIKSLEREVEVMKMALTKSEEELVDKINELEEKLFSMDQEYEAQTTKFKRQYDSKMKDELEQRLAKMKVDFQYSLGESTEDKMLSMCARIIARRY